MVVDEVRRVVRSLSEADEAQPRSALGQRRHRRRRHMRQHVEINGAVVNNGGEVLASLDCARPREIARAGEQRGVHLDITRLREPVHCRRHHLRQLGRPQRFATGDIDPVGRDHREADDVVRPQMLATERQHVARQRRQHLRCASRLARRLVLQ
jgi:hypothetical protein